MKEFEFKKVWILDTKKLVLLFIALLLFYIFLYYVFLGFRIIPFFVSVLIGMGFVTIPVLIRFFSTNLVIKLSDSELFIRTKNRTKKYNRECIEEISMPDYSKMQETLFFLTIKLKNGKELSFQSFENTDKYDEEKKTKLYRFSKYLLENLNLEKTEQTKNDFIRKTKIYTFVQQLSGSFENNTKPLKPVDYKEFVFKSMITNYRFTLFLTFLIAIAIFGLSLLVTKGNFIRSFMCLTVLLIFAVLQFLLKLCSKDVYIRLNKDFLSVKQGNSRISKYKISDLTGFYSHDYTKTNELLKNSPNYTITLKFYFKSGERISIVDNSLFGEKYSKGKDILLRRFLRVMEEEYGFKPIRKNRWRSLLKLGEIWYSKE